MLERNNQPEYDDMRVCERNNQPGYDRMRVCEREIINQDMMVHSFCFINNSL